MHKFSIITPCYNAEKYIKETLQSVLLQTAVKKNGIELEYIVIDGGSTDQTIPIIEEMISSFQEKNVQIKFLSEKDQGMYDALVKGIHMVTGDICAYINADDFYNIHAFDIVSNIMEQDKIKWLTGINVHYNVDSEIIWAHIPYKYRTRLIQRGVYGTLLPFIQQESTFWKTELHDEIQFEKLRSMKYAGDYFLWYQFSRKAELYIVQAILSGFRICKGQLSSDKATYRKEMDGFIEYRMGLSDHIRILGDKILWQFPQYNKKIIKYSNELNRWM